MNDVRFEINHMNSVFDDFNKVQKELKDCVYDFQINVRKIEIEINEFNAEANRVIFEIRKNQMKIRDLIGEVRSRKVYALDQKQDLIPEPPAPKIPDNSTYQQIISINQIHHESVIAVRKQNEQIRIRNQEIDVYANKCEDTIRKLLTISEGLDKYIDAVKKTIAEVQKEVEPFLSIVNMTMVEGRRIDEATVEFSLAFKKTLEQALKIIQMVAVNFEGQSFVDRQFKIKNTHQHNIESTSSFDFTTFDQVIYNKEVKNKSKNSLTVVKERNIDDFLLAINNLTIFKMPSANLHKLGGNKFIEKMIELGYVMITHSNGATIDDNGMIHWEKR